MDFNRREMEDAGWTFTEDGVGIPPSGEQSEASHVTYKAPKREPMSPEIIQAIVDGMPMPSVESDLDSIQLMGVDPSIRVTGAAKVHGYRLQESPMWDTAFTTVKTVSDGDLRDRLASIAYTVSKFSCALGKPNFAIVEGHYWQPSSGVSPTSIQTYCEAVGTCYGVLSTICLTHRVDPDWMPRILCGRVKGGTTKEDRHAIAEALLRRAGSAAWPSNASEHEKDALCLCVAYLVEEGWL